MLRRAAKTALAAVLATWIAKLLELQNPWFATLAAVVAMEITLRASLSNARNTLIGAGVGAAAGLGLAVIAKEELWAVGLLILLAFLVFGWLRMEPVGRQAALVASVVLLVPERTDLSTPRFAFVRFAETAIGIAVALAVNRWVFPPHAYLDARRHLAHAIRRIDDLYALAVERAARTPGEASDAPIDAVTDAIDAGNDAAEADAAARRAVREQLRAVDALWEEALDERPPHQVLGPHWRAATRRIWEQCTVLLATAPVARTTPLLDPARPAMDRLATATRAGLDQLATALEDRTPAQPDRPLVDHERLESARAALLDAMREVERIDAGPPVAVTLQCFAHVNAMTTIAARLVDLDDPSRTTPAVDDDQPPTDAGP